MKSIEDIKFGFSDAENYRRRENKHFFSQIFLRTDAMEKLDEPQTFFLIGEKGTGKTAYAVSRSSNPTKHTESRHIFIRETDYTKFVNLKRENGLGISDYVDVWKIILLLSISQGIIDISTIIDRISQGANYGALKKAMDVYYKQGLDPEIVTGLQFVENYEQAVEILLQAHGGDKLLGVKGYAKGGEKTSSGVQSTRHFFRGAWQLSNKLLNLP